ncbi:MAG: DUF1801 domain-containing protein [Paracoccaceae bacterium]
MIYEATTPEDYLSVQDDDWRKERLLTIRDVFLAVPGATEGMQYKMLHYAVGDISLGLLNAQRAYVAIYMDDLTVLDPDGNLRNGLDCGKSCVRVKKRSDMDKVAALIALRVELQLG